MNEQLQALQRIIDSSNNIVAFTGAGCSTESGIPDFRSSAHKMGSYAHISTEIGS